MEFDEIGRLADGFSWAIGRRGEYANVLATGSTVDLAVSPRGCVCEIVVLGPLPGRRLGYAAACVAADGTAAVSRHLTLESARSVAMTA